MTHRIKLGTVPSNLAGKLCYIQSEKPDSNVVIVKIQGEGSYKYLRREIEEATE